MSKSFSTYSNQLIHLRDSRKLTISDESFALACLKKYGYYNLINGYKKPFKSPDGSYSENASFEDIVELYRFDAKLRELFLRYLLLVESKIKSVTSYHFCCKHGTLQDSYLDVNNYKYKSPNIGNINFLVSTLDKELKSDKPYLEHARTKHNNVPLWVLVNAITFGRVYKIYQFSSDDVRTAIAKEYDHLNEKQLETVLRIANDCRNICAHGEPLYTFSLRRYSIHDTLIHGKLKIPKSAAGMYRYGKSDLFSVVVALRYILDNDDFKSFKRELARTIDSYKNGKKAAAPADLLDIMGFPFNWKDITRFRAF